MLTTRIAALHFAPTPAARDALLAEGVPPGDVHLTGNTVIDALLQTVRPDYRFRTPALAALDPARRLVLVTTHRRESFGAPLRSTCAAIRELAGAVSRAPVRAAGAPEPRGQADRRASCSAICRGCT